MVMPTAMATMDIRVLASQPILQPKAPLMLLQKHSCHAGSHETQHSMQGRPGIGCSHCQDLLISMLCSPEGRDS